ncbi:hypothetical protein SAY86_025529 [Trapa natans]|uniref:Uncharacterized protein n=1 Tax=Trapa natans TaxID=22666 RepID=A0AAN7RCF5_TRANT|nr:hypothetical protein SAY86_025529 [Trapa natans]
MSWPCVISVPSFKSSQAPTAKKTSFTSSDGARTPEVPSVGPVTELYSKGEELCMPVVFSLSPTD